MYSRLLARNLIMMLLPIIISMSVLAYVSYRVLETDDFRVYYLNDVEDIEDYYRDSKTNVYMNASVLRYLERAGFESRAGDTVRGEYYYMFDDSSLMIFLIKTGDHDDYIYAKLVVDEPTISYMESEYLSSIDSDIIDIDGYISSYIVSEPDFPMVKIYGVKAVFYASLVTAVCMFIYMVVAAFIPVLNFETGRLRRLGKRSHIIRELNEEMRAEDVIVDGRVITTRSYVVTVMISEIIVERRPLSDSMMLELLESASSGALIGDSVDTETDISEDEPHMSQTENEETDMPADTAAETMNEVTDAVSEDMLEDMSDEASNSTDDEQ